MWFVSTIFQGTKTNFNFTFSAIGTYDVFWIARTLVEFIYNKLTNQIIDRPIGAPNNSLI
jgi:hypothetical protein